MQALLRIGELVEVAAVETVVRLDGRGGHLAQLVATGDVKEALASLLEAAKGPAGRAFFVVGPFGSGKSHLLAAAGELVSGEAVPPQSWPVEVAKVAAGARRSLAVRVPLVDYRAELALEDVVAARAWRCVGSSPPQGGDRREHWDEFLGSARAAGYEGVAVLVDELSEWLRAKRGAALTEDLRFLQFLGEWAKDRPALVLAALQESIEEVANVSEKELTRIRDRYQDLRLTMRHVEDLVRGRLVRLLPGAQAAVEIVEKQMAASFPGAHFDPARFARCYPLHPATLDLLEGLRFLLSQNRGVVDFVHRQVQAVLESPASALVTADRIWDHFQERLMERRETARLANAVVPYWERAVHEMFEKPDAKLALRAVKVLSLLSVSPLERPRSAAELAAMLLARVSETDPVANVTYMESVVLERVVARGAYVVALSGKPTTYSVEAGADAAVALEARLQTVRAELSEADRRMVTTLEELGSTAQLPLGVMRSAGVTKRQVMWQNTERFVTVTLARVAEWAPEDARKAEAAAANSGAEAALVLAEPELADAEELAERARALVRQGGGRLGFWVPAALSGAELASLTDIHSRQVVHEQASQEGREDLVELLERGRDAHAARAREILSRIYFSGSLVLGADGGEPATPDLPSLAGRTFESQLPHLVAPLLARLHPLHARVAPRAELRGDRVVQRLVNEFIAPGHLAAGALERSGLRGAIETYLVPLGVARTRKEGASVTPDPARSPAVAEVVRLAGDEGTVEGPWLVGSLGQGPLGLTEREAVLLLNACARAGLVERWRHKQKVPEAFLAVTATDRFGPGELVEQSLREAVAALSPVTGPGPFEPWTASTQRDAWQHAQAWLETRREEMAQVRSGLEYLDDFPALSPARTAAAQADLRAIEGVLEACAGAASPAAGLRALAGAAASSVAGPEQGGAGAQASELQAAARRISALARFFRDELRRLGEAASYVTHPELTIPDSADEALRRLRSVVTEALPEVLVLAAEDRLGELTSAIAEFRRAYVAAYRDAHDRYYGQVSPADIASLQASPLYRALAALSELGTASVPDGKVKVDRMVAASVPAPCTRRVEQELSWKPRCSCGFSLGDPLPKLDAPTVLHVAERGVRQHLAELCSPAIAERLREAKGQLEALGRTELADDLSLLVDLAAKPDEADPLAVVSVASPELQKVLRDVLAGGQLIVARDLATLREDLIGRRYTKRRLLELLAAWVDPEGDLPSGGLVEVVDGSETKGTKAPGSMTGPLGAPGGSRTVAFLQQRFPSVAAALPAEGAADAFWLAAWWAGGPLSGAGEAGTLLGPRGPSGQASLFGPSGRPDRLAQPVRRHAPPAWVPRALLDEPKVALAASAAHLDPDALAELASLDGRCGPGTALGEHVERALGLGEATLAEVSSALSSERLLRYPLRLAASQLVRRLASDWQAASDIVDLSALASAHYLVTSDELAPLSCVLEASRHLAEVERRLSGASCAQLVEELYPEHMSKVPALLSRALLVSAGPSLLDLEPLEAFSASARRALGAAGEVFARYAAGGFPGCLRIDEVGRALVKPLLSGGNKVAVVLVDAMRADAARLVADTLALALPGRELQWHWAVVPEPTRTAESMAAMALGHPVPAGETPVRPDAHGVALAPFEHLGYEVALLRRADRDHNAAQLRELWSSPAPLMVAVASSLDERLHHSCVELAVLLDDAARSIAQRLIASLAALPPSVPVVLMADHGFKENPAWGKGPEGRYTHGGTSLEECVVPVVVAR
jgi:hypothetical protein